MNKTFILIGISLFTINNVVSGIDETTGKLISGSITKKYTQHDQHIIELWQDANDPRKFELKLLSNSYNVTIDFLSDFESKHFCYDLKVILFIESEKILYKCASEIYIDEIPLHCEKYEGKVECEFLRIPTSYSPKMDSTISPSSTSDAPTSEIFPSLKEETPIKTTISTPLHDIDNYSYVENKIYSTCDCTNWLFFEIILFLLVVSLIIASWSIYNQHKLLQVIMADKLNNHADIQILKDEIANLKKFAGDFQKNVSDSFHKLNVRLGSVPGITGGYV